MGLRAGAYATVWSVEQSKFSDKVMQVQLSVSRKNKQTDEYEQEFSGFVSFIGQAASDAKTYLAKGSRIKLVDVDVTNTYNKEKKETKWAAKCFKFERMDGNKSSNTSNDDYPFEGDTGAVEDKAEDADNLPW